MKNEKNELLYLTVYNSLKEDIISGAYAFKDKLPSKRVTADRFGVSLITVEHAYDLLLSEGYVEAKERSGYYSSYSNGDGFLSVVNNEKEKDVAKVTSNTVNNFPISLYSKAARKVLSEYKEKIFTKCDIFGCETLRYELSKYLKRTRNMFVEDDQIVIGAGAEYLYGLIAELFGNKISVGIEKPSYEKIEKAYKSKGIKVEYLELGNDGIESRFLNSCRSDIIHITPYRSYPSKISASPSKRNEYLRWAKSRQGYIIEDDYESEFCISGKVYDTLYSMSANDDVIYINTFSKTISSGIRIAYLVLPNKLKTLFSQKLSFYSCAVPTLDQLILAEILKSGEFNRNINRIRRKLKQNLDAKT
ncbi:MAG: PLP-dependent aminotransferase family protein [Clostridia bacterium]|nr:PLP-dependent aminotransferase family protein [Clostridia bacterium]